MSDTTAYLARLAWHAGLVDLGLSLDGIDRDELRALFDRMLATHLSWVAAGSP